MSDVCVCETMECHGFSLFQNTHNLKHTEKGHYLEAMDHVDGILSTLWECGRCFSAWLRCLSSETVCTTNSIYFTFRDEAGASEDQGGFWEIKPLFPNLIYFWSQRKHVNTMKCKTNVWTCGFGNFANLLFLSVKPTENSHPGSTQQCYISVQGTDHKHVYTF